MAFQAKTNWKNNDIVNAAEFNRIEKGIQANETAINEALANTLTNNSIVNTLGQGGTNKVASAEIVKQLYEQTQNKILTTVQAFVNAMTAETLEKGKLYFFFWGGDRDNNTIDGSFGLYHYLYNNQTYKGYTVEVIATKDGGSVHPMYFQDFSYYFAKVDDNNKKVLTLYVVNFLQGLDNKVDYRDFQKVPLTGGRTSWSGSNVYSIVNNAAIYDRELKDQIGIVFTAHANSTGTPYLKINHSVQKPIVKPNGQPAKLSANGVYTVRYNQSTGNFTLQGEGASGNATASDLITGKTATTDAGEIVGTIPIVYGNVITPKPYAQSAVAAGNYVGSEVIVAGDSDLKPANIRQGINIFGVNGTFSGDYSAIANALTNKGIPTNTNSTQQQIIQNMSNLSVPIFIDFFTKTGNDFITNYSGDLRRYSDNRTLIVDGGYTTSRQYGMYKIPHNFSGSEKYLVLVNPSVANSNGKTLATAFYPYITNDTRFLTGTPVSSLILKSLTPLIPQVNYNYNSYGATIVYKIPSGIIGTYYFVFANTYDDNDYYLFDVAMQGLLII